MKITRYHVFIGLMMLLFLIGLFSPQENNYPGQEGNDNFTDDFINNSQPADESPLMSTPDNVLSDEKDWWKHDGHSTVSGSNLAVAGSSDESSENNGNEKNNNGNNDSEEIPEFPNLVIPFIAAIGIAMFFRRK
ncbi:hypothetical protein RE474_03360 [Methanolobus sediminis]|uniref:PEF-CTERM protein sorting domain-containing protein n=1 Tax=Methanolobus sediminis TaxID=3072978 RepID=A0AA51ULX1_9EURY|nr:hypothetical protein [Methanolobus sediminis]WMW25770.1 hypothetical protein RE474_03360 [Methanolobus sediminis]